MDLKDAVELYREVLRRYSQGFSLEEVLGSVAEALGGECAVFFVRKELSSFLEPRLAWNVSEADKERIDGRLIPMDWVARQPARRYIVVEREKLSELGLEGVCRDPSGVAVMFPVRSHAHLRAALLTVIPDRVSLPDQQSYRAAAVAAVLEKMVELFAFEDRAERQESEKETSAVELGILSSYVIGKADHARAASLSLDLLIKLLNMDGGTVHRVTGAPGEQRAALVASRGWGWMPEIVDHLFENNLIDLLQAMRRSQEGEFCLDAGRIAEYFPAESLVSIDIRDPDATRIVQETIRSDRWLRNIDAIAEARRLVLERHQLFSFVAQEIRRYEEGIPGPVSYTPLTLPKRHSV